MSSPLPVVFVAASFVVFIGCGGEGDRDAVVHEALARDNRDLALRDPREVEARFARMARDPFSFFRGSVGLWARDITTPGAPGALPSAFLDGVASGVLLIGDPHPENLGTLRVDDGLLFGWNDFDVARFGPAVFDLRRLALGFAVGLVDVDVDVLVGALVDGYVAGLRDPTLFELVDRDDTLGDDGDGGRIARELFQRARARAGVDDDVVRDGALVIADDVPADLEADVLVAVDDDEADALLATLEMVGFAPRQVAQSLGRGVGSRPLRRHVALLHDGRVLQIKEARDPFVLRGYLGEHARFFVDNGERVASSRRALVGHDGADDALRALPSLRALAGPSLTTSEDGELQTIRLARIQASLADGALGEDDVVAFAELSGRLLAAAHRRGLTVDGDVVGDALGDAMGINDDAPAAALRRETLDATEDSLEVAKSDHRRLAKLLEREGPLLGLPVAP